MKRLTAFRGRRGGSVTAARSAPVACLLAAWLGAGAVGGCPSPYLMTVEDVICPVGDKTKLVGKLEYRGVAVLNKGLEDRDLEFSLDGQPVGNDDTNDEGYARMERPFPVEGVYRLGVTYRDRDGRLHTASAGVFVWSRDRPVLVVDIDDTVAQTEKRYLLGLGEDRSPPLPGAAEVLGELAEHFNVAYLTARPRELAEETRRWLTDNGFPLGPVLTWDIDKDAFSATKYKKHRLDELTDRFKHVTIGVGNAEGDHEAYRKRKLLTILIDADEEAALIERGIRLPSWPEVRRLFVLNPHLYDTGLSNEVALRWHPD